MQVIETIKHCTFKIMAIDHVLGLTCFGFEISQNLYYQLYMSKI